MTGSTRDLACLQVPLKRCNDIRFSRRICLSSNNGGSGSPFFLKADSPSMSSSPSVLMISSGSTCHEVMRGNHGRDATAVRRSLPARAARAAPRPRAAWSSQVTAQAPSYPQSQFSTRFRHKFRHLHLLHYLINQRCRNRVGTCRYIVGHSCFL